MKENRIYNFIFLLIIPIFVLGLYFFITPTTKAKADSIVYTYTFNYLEEYWVEDGQEYFGENVLINATNDIVQKNKDGWAVKDIAEDYYCTMNYGEFSNKYYLIWQTKSIKVRAGERPNVNSIRTNFDCFYNIFSHWNIEGTSQVFINRTLPIATTDMTFTANYEIKNKILLNSDDEYLLTYYPNNYTEIELYSRDIKVNDKTKTVYFYSFDLQSFKKLSESHYKYFLFKNADMVLDINYEGLWVEEVFKLYKISPININNDDLVIELYSNFKDQNQFNNFRSNYTKKNYQSNLGDMFADIWINLTGNDGILDNTISMISSGASISSGITKTASNIFEGASNSIWIFTDFTSNFKATIVYIITIIIACLIAFVLLKFFFWFIGSIKKLTKKGVNKSVR